MDTANRANSEDQTILKFEEVTIADDRESGREISGVTFGVASGELVLIEDWSRRFPLADYAEGLISPPSGTVNFRGEDWAALPPAAAARSRGRIGRFFPRSGWVSNLNVDENITLGLRHHSHLPLEEIDEEAVALSERLNLPPPPPIRPALIPEADLTGFQLVRAFLGSPSLIILDRFTPSEYNEALNNEIDRVRERGAGVLVISGKGDRCPDNFSAPDRIFRVEGDSFQAC